MLSCPNCGRPTRRTEDWACQWCGYPLSSTSYKKLDKTYRQLREEERSVWRIPEPEPEAVREYAPEPAPKPAPEPTPEPEPQPPLPVREPEPMPEPEPKPTSEPVIELGPAPVLAPESEPEPVPELMREPESPPVPEPEPPPMPRRELDLTSSIVEATVEELNSAVRTDISAVDTQLKSKTLRVTGVIEKVVIKEIFDTQYVLLTSTNRGDPWSVRCTFDKKDGPALSVLSEGQTATIQGEYDGYQKNIILKDCVLVR